MDRESRPLLRVKPRRRLSEPLQLDLDFSEGLRTKPPKAPLRPFRLRARWRATWRALLRRTPRRVLKAAPLIASLLAHLGFLVLLAFLMAALRRPDPAAEIDLGLFDDLTSLSEADRAGDPFTRLDSLEAPSLPSEADRHDPFASGTPEVRLAPEIALEPDSAAFLDASESRVGKSRGISKPGTTSAMFSGRRGPSKAKLVRREGGTEESEAAVERGLDWIARHQRADGGWALDTSYACEAPGCPPRAAMTTDTGATGLALLPLLAAGHTHTERGRYQRTVTAGLRWLVKTQQPSGALYVGGDGITPLYSHAIATMALCEAYGLTHDPALRTPAARAVRFLAGAQASNGGWRYQPKQAGDTSVFGWVIFALRSANMAELPVPRQTVRFASAYLRAAAADGEGSTYSYTPGSGPKLTMTAEGLVTRQILGWPRDHPGLLGGAALVAADLRNPSDRNIYYWYYATQLLHNLDDDRWPAWNEKIREALVATQVRGAGCDRGSWDPTFPESDLWGARAGRLYQTSLSLLTLEVYYRYLPLYRDRGGELVGADTPVAEEGPGAEPSEESFRP